MEKRGIPAIPICTTAFEALAEAEKEALFMPNLDVIIVEHPLADRPDGEIHAIADGALDRIAKMLTCQ